MNVRNSIPINYRLKDIDGNLIEQDELHGEMYIKGPCMMSGYLDNPTATAAAMDKDGWLRTGDIAYTIKGKVYIIDRAKVRHCPTMPMLNTALGGRLSHPRAQKWRPTNARTYPRI